MHLIVGFFLRQSHLDCEFTGIVYKELRGL